MRIKTYVALILSISFYQMVSSQSIADFISVMPAPQSDEFIFPSTHRFQKIIESGDPLTTTGVFPIKPDFTGYVPISNSSTNGYLSINSEHSLGNVTVLDINFNGVTKLWETTASESIDFSSVGGTSRNCSGAVTPWGTIISSEENATTTDDNSDNYYDFGWNVEIDPATKTVINKLWALGNFRHENVAIHNNQRTVYQGADSNPGFLYKFVADTAQDLNSGSLYVYIGSKNGSGNWVQLQNDTPAERNSTLEQSNAVSATVFNGIEDVEIGPDGMVYFAVKGEFQVYRFQDSDPIIGTTAIIETFVGNMAYDITHSSGVSSLTWAYGNDNLAFDNLGNLWVFQDGGDDYIWVVGSNHTQVNPEVRLFGIAPSGSEPTGITFTPDYKYLFMSIQHPNIENSANQIDAEGNTISFNKGTVLVLALEENLGPALSLEDIHSMNIFEIYPNPIAASDVLTIEGKDINILKLYSIQGQLLQDKKVDHLTKVEFDTSDLDSGIYFLQINNMETLKLVVKN